MKRIQIPTRLEWHKKVENLGFNYHTIGNVYWDESAYYSFSLKQIDTLEQATATLWQLYLEATEYVINKNKFNLFHIPPQFHKHIIDSWENDVPSIYGRFDFCYDGISEPKLLEFNADTPTSLFEAGVVQWNWLQDVFPNNDQFNAIHEKLIDNWTLLKPYLNSKKVYFSCVDASLEDYTNTVYMLDTAMQAGLEAEFISIENLGWNGKYMTDLKEQEVKSIFKLYPWEWMIKENFGVYIPISNTQWIEPSWKILMTSKAMLPILWELFPKHKNLLACYTNNSKLNSYAKKPIFSREGDNITLVEKGIEISLTNGVYGTEGYIYQELCKLPNFDGNYPVIGSWIIGQDPAGIGIRETKSLITDNLSRFLPHLIEG